MTSTKVNGPTGTRTTVSATLVSVITFVGIALVACTNGTQAYCNDLERNAGLKELSSSLQKGDLTAAAKSAGEFGRLADSAPEEIRSDMRKIADGVADIVALLEQERRETSVSENDLDPATETEQLRDDLNERFDDLDRRSMNVETWATRNCGIDLS